MNQALIKIIDKIIKSGKSLRVRDMRDDRSYSVILLQEDGIVLDGPFNNTLTINLDGLSKWMNMSNDKIYVRYGSIDLEFTSPDGINFFEILAR